MENDDIDEQEFMIKVEEQESWIKVFFNGYFFSFTDLFVNVEIKIEEEGKPTRTLTCSSIEEKDGKVEITEFLKTFISISQENPNKKVTAYLTGFGKQMHFDKNLLKSSSLMSIYKLFDKEKNDQ